MAVYRWLAYDLRSNVALQELPLSVRQYGGALNEAGRFSGQIPLDPSQASYISSATIPERTIIFVERDGVIIPDSGYIIWRRVRTPGGAMQIDGLGIASLLRRNRIVADLTYTTTDQFTIAQGIVNHLQSQAGANFGITVGATTSGVTRTRKYNGYERKNVGDALDELAACFNGFDWAIDCAWGVSSPSKTLTLSYPRRGRIAGTTGVIFSTGKNIIDYTFTEDGSRSARAVDIFGSGDGKDMKVSTAVATALLDEGYPLTTETLAFKDITTASGGIDDRVVAAMNARAKTPGFLELTVTPDDIDAGLGTWIVGDDAYVEITDDNFPRKADGSPGYTAYFRIIGYTVNVPDSGPEVVNVTLGPIAIA
jgi:hypothetical protein